jgi:tetratricopeptide (TPR) repeat protein
MRTPPAATELSNATSTNQFVSDPIDDFARQLELIAGDAQASLKLGGAMQQQGRLADAEAAYRQSLASDPGLDEAACNLNQVLVMTGREQEASSLCEQRLPISKSPATLLERLGMALASAKNMEAAEACYRRAVAVQPDSFLALNNLAALLYDLDHFAEAEHLARRGVAAAPEYLHINLNLASIVDSMGRIEEAVALYRRVLSLYPDCAEAYVGLGHLSAVRHSYGSAEKLLLKALTENSQVRGGQNSLGKVYLMTNRIDDAERAFSQELVARPDYAMSRFNLSCIQLLRGDFDKGWEGYEARWSCVLKNRRRDFDAPCWDGRDLLGKTLMIHHEQGFGDTLHLIRYALLAASKAAKVVVVVQKSLYRLLQGISGIRVVTIMPQHYDAYCYMASLPLKFNTTPETIPAQVPYIAVPASAHERWSELFAAAPTSGQRNPRIGVVWAGQAQHTNDKNRSIPFESLTSLFSIEGVQWVSLQKERRPDEMDDYVAQHGWLDPMGEVEDYEDTAAIVEQLDLVICVDTSVTHLAGALGKPVWLLLPSMPDWRWLLNSKDSSPWYPTMRLFRQTYPEGWGPVIERVAQALLDTFSGTRLGEPIPASLDSQVPDQQAAWEQNDHGINIDLMSGNDGLNKDHPAWLEKLQERYKTCPFWYHQIELPGGIITPGWAPLNRDAYDLPDRLDGLRVLDVGAWDGYWTFEALRRGAREVVAIDNFSDTLSVPADRPWRDWQNFDVCREALGFDESVCKRMTLSVYDVSEETLGRFDVVFFFGIFNQLRDPLGALEKVAALCDQSLFVEAAVADDFSPYKGGLNRGYPQGDMLMEFYPDAQLGNAQVNFWAPTMQALAAMIHGLDFAEVEGWKLDEYPIRAAHCRGFVKGTRAASEDGQRS